MFKLIATILLMTLVGCEQQAFTKTSDGGEAVVIKQTDSRAHEFCYKGNVYIRFSYDNSVWGGAMFSGDKPVTC